jgi:pyruvate/2-oxoglutarate dehydrogenase complex dihydrolipoamide acyltransferase (E2) component
MAQLLTLEALYPEMEEATIGCWLVEEGAVVAVDTPLLELITDKVAYEYKSPAAGILIARLPTEKSTIPVGTTLGALGAPGEELAERERLTARNRDLARQREAQLTTLLEATAAEAVTSAPAPRAVRATPAARRRARDRGVDLRALTGSGPDGLIVEEDIP